MMTYTNTGSKDTRSGFGAGLLKLGTLNPQVVALCADLTGSLKMDAFQKQFPERFFQKFFRPVQEASCGNRGAKN